MYCNIKCNKSTTKIEAAMLSRYETEEVVENQNILHLLDVQEIKDIKNIIKVLLR